MTNGYVATSSRDYESSSGASVGYFTSKLEYSLTYGSFAKGSVTAVALFDYAAPLTVTASGGAQHPQSNGHANGSLLLTKPAYNVSIENKFTGLSNQGTIKINNNTTSLPENNRREYYNTSLQLEIINQTINGIDYTFSKWENSSTSYSRTISVTSAINPQAYFTGKPSTANRNQQITSSNGQPITLQWNANPNANVTAYRIYRKIGHTGTPSLIATTSDTTFTDPDYTMTGNSEDTYLMYDVRPYYSLEQTESVVNFQTAAFGRIELSRFEDKQTASTLSTVPNEYSITNYPNPFNPTTTINYQLPENGFVTIKVYDMLGKEVATLVNENKSAGYHIVNFDASKLTSGVYVYMIAANNFIQSKKMLLMK